MPARRCPRPAISIRSNGGWTFGSPSVLMMFYRAPGKLAGELAEMAECACRTTIRSPTVTVRARRPSCAPRPPLLQGRFTDAHIALESAYAQIEGNGQENMALCCDFSRSAYGSRCTRRSGHRSFAERRTELLRHHATPRGSTSGTPSPAPTATPCRGEMEQIPEVFAEHRLASVSILAPGRPMIEMIENQVYLAQGAYAKVIGRSEGLLALCEGCTTRSSRCVRLQTASALAAGPKRGKDRTGRSRAFCSAARSSVRSAMTSPVTCMVLADHG